MIRAVTRLCRIPLSLANALSALAGYLLGHPQLSTDAARLCGAVFLLAAGASALNQILDRDLDALMKRTCNRPLPSGTLPPITAFACGSSALLAGLLLLTTPHTPAPVLLGVAALAIYLGIYTPLKRRTTLALPLGAICGALPPLIGWSMAGGTITDHRALLLSGIMFIWQIPHFWLLHQRHANDYRQAGIPIYHAGRGIQLLWVAALGATLLMLPLFGLVAATQVVWIGGGALLLFILTLLRIERGLAFCLTALPLLLVLLISVSRHQA